MSAHAAKQYREEIDGIRAIAVLSVIVYHLKIAAPYGYFMQGGFLGVDVFFVISGFLITRIILAERAETGRFNLWTFYVRRARRILPALLLVILASCVAAYFLMLPSELDRFASSILAALGFFSNVFWFFTLGEYGAQSGLVQPLLHTWSLAIEEQFYLVFPLLLMLIPSKRFLLLGGILAFLLVASLVLAQITTQFSQELSFFSPVSRAWQLLAGSLLAMADLRWSRAARGPVWLAWGAPKLALLVLALSMILIDLGEVAHPGIATLPTVLASMALLWFARPGEGVTRALSLAPMVHIGKLSYSLYLWHFPIFAFGRLASVEAPGALDYGIWLGLTYVASRLGYHLVERRFRFDVKGFLFAGSLASALAVLGAFVLIVKQTDLLIGPRASDVAALYGENEIDNAALRDLSWQPLMTLKGEDLATIRDARGKPTEADISKLTFAEGTELNVLVLGNSHAKDFFNALYLNAAAFEGLGFSRFGIQAGFSRRERDLLYASPDFARADVILIAPRYARRDAEVLGEFIDELRARGKNVGVVGNTAQFVSPGTVPIYDWFVQRHQTRPDPARLAQIAFASEESEPRRRNAALRTVAEAHGAVYFSRRDLMCDEAARGCALTTPEGRKTMFDYGHWTLEGARYFGSLVAEQGWLAQFERP